jgi:DNA-binding GntR family transcriptional regulator
VIAADLRRRLSAGEWPAGARLPADPELMAAYYCGRGTVQRAMQIVTGTAWW